MLILGHVGITFGVALAAESLSSHTDPAHAGSQCGLLARLRYATASLARRIDLRILLIGTLLPDIIDKPLGYILLPGVFGTGRLFCHALIFPIVLAAAGVWLYRARRSTHLLVLAYGAGMHLVLDAMWRTPSILFWPFAGPMPRGDAAAGEWLARIITTLLTNPAAYLPEIAGVILLVPLLWAIFRGAGPGHFIRSGDVN
jgi:membrane-bound metal-dependent hydrolase YbcI (DUF457 family)